VDVLVAPERGGRVDLRWLMRALGRQQVTRLLVEGGGEVHGALVDARLVHRVAFFYAPKILGDRAARPAVAGAGAKSWAGVLRLAEVATRRAGPDLFLTARVLPRQGTAPAPGAVRRAPAPNSGTSEITGRPR
jgi:diaminohydroxyphosphoribosylaminopyrimidine deaminase/5-amino-6-(5-phosphoribosylamino)uracil reductase